MDRIVAPSLLTADLLRLKENLIMLNASFAEWIHLDIMDGVFVPNISFGFSFIETVRDNSHRFLDVHLMIQNADKYINRFRDAGADLLTVHFEACPHLHRTVQNIKNAGMRVGVALNPHSPVDYLQDILSDLDMVLIMSVNPGYGGQKLIPQTYEKLKKLKRLLKRTKKNVKIQVDGGVIPENAAKLYEAGANVLVAGNSVFGSLKPQKAIEDILYAGL